MRDRGEFAWIEKIRRRVARGPASRNVALGIGDDAALLRLRAGEQLAVSTDAFVEGVHFRFRNESARTIGRRAVVAALSDLAAMGARPLGCTWSLAAPSELPGGEFSGLSAGVVDEAQRWGAPLVGGNLTRANEVSLHLTALGATGRGKALTRQGVRVGDRILVTGTLGGVALERALAERGQVRVRRVPVPRLSAGRVLARIPALACIDISDGLAADLSHLLSPGLALPLELARVPVPRGFLRRCEREALDPEALALRGGQDYELLFALRGSTPTVKSLERRLSTRVTELGRVEKVRLPATRTSPAPGGWEHF